MKTFNKRGIATVVAVSIALGITGLVMAVTTVNLGTASNFAILAGSGITITGAASTTTITGDIGTSPTPSITGLENLVLTGANHADDATTTAAKIALTTAYNTAASSTPSATIPTELGGFIYGPGVYNSSAGKFEITGTTTLDGQGDPNALFIFQATSTLVTAGASHVSLINGAQACNVFWQVGSSATLGGASFFKGSILALTSIGLGNAASVEGRLLAQEGAVTLDTNAIVVPVCGGALHVIKNVVNTGGGMATSSDFTLHVASGTDVSGSPQLGTTTPGTFYLLSAGSYTVSEPATTTYTQSFSADCPSGVVTLASGDNKTCTVTNTYNIPTGTLHVIKQVVNTGGGTATSSDFTLHVASGTPLVDVSGSPQLGTTTPGTTYTLAPDSYTVFEPATTTYTQSFSDDCHSGVVILASGADITCTVTNTYIIPTPPAPVIISSGGSYFLYTKPSIKIVKVPTPLSLPNGPGVVVYDYYVSNTGINAMSSITVTDNKCSTVKFISGDSNGDGKLDVNEIWKYSCAMTLPETTTNIAVASGYADTFTVTNSTNATVVVSSPLVTTTTPIVLAVATTTVPVVVTTYPTLPDAGYAPKETTYPWNMIIVVGLITVSALLFTAKREKINI